MHRFEQTVQNSAVTSENLGLNYCRNRVIYFLTLLNEVIKVCGGVGIFFFNSKETKEIIEKSRRIGKKNSDNN